MKLSTFFATGVAFAVGAVFIASPVVQADEEKTIYQRANNDPQFELIIKAIDQAELMDTLNEEGDFTVFAPTDQAFRELGSTLDTLLEDENKELLRDILLYHTIDINLSKDALLEQVTVETIQTGSVNIIQDGDTVKVNNSASVVLGDIPASNGVVHVIDKVLLSQDLTNKINEVVSTSASQDESSEPVANETEDAPTQVEENDQPTQETNQDSVQDDSETNQESSADPVPSQDPTTAEPENGDVALESQDDLVRTGDNSLFTTGMSSIVLAGLFVFLAYSISKKVFDGPVPFKNL